MFTSHRISWLLQSLLAVLGIKAFWFAVAALILMTLASRADAEQIHIHARVDTSASRMSDADVRAACSRVNEIWNPHGIDFTFTFAAGCTKDHDAKDLHVHVGGSRGGALGYSNARACNTVRDGQPGQTGSVIAHEIAHCFGLENRS